MSKMRFKNLTDNDKEFIINCYNNRDLTWDNRVISIMNKFGITERTVRHWWVTLGCKQKCDAESEQYEKAKSRVINQEKKVFLISWAQNNTPVHKKLFKKMKMYAEERDADIHIIAGRYKNPTSVHIDKTYDFWADDLLPYLDASRHKIHPRLVVFSDVKIQPTAVNPLSGVAGMSGTDSCIFGHPRAHFEITAALEGHPTKAMWTTGACTVENYTDSKSGKLGEFHHVLGFLVVEIDDSDINNVIFHIRRVIANKNGDFYDLFYKVNDKGVHINNKILAAVLGDIHVGDTDNELIHTTKEELLRLLNPSYTILHDVFNGHSISHHERHDPIKSYHKLLENKHSLKKEIDELLSWLEEMIEFNLVVVRSNHDNFVDRWIIDADWKKDLTNSAEYLEYSRVLLNNEAKKGIIPYLINKRFGNKIITLGRDDSFMVKDCECGHHGDLGSNGSRGSITQFRRLNTKMITAHTHSPSQKDGAATVGTSTKLRIGYNKGASNWLNTHAIIHENGKYQHITFIKSGNKFKFTTQKIN